MWFVGTVGVGKLITETRANQAQWVGGSIAPPSGREGGLLRERDRDGPIRAVLQRLATEVCTSVK